MLPAEKKIEHRITPSWRDCTEQVPSFFFLMVCENQGFSAGARASSRRSSCCAAAEGLRSKTGWLGRGAGSSQDITQIKSCCAGSLQIVNIFIYLFLYPSSQAQVDLLSGVTGLYRLFNIITMSTCTAGVRAILDEWLTAVFCALVRSYISLDTMFRTGLCV